MTLDEIVKKLESCGANPRATLSLAPLRQAINLLDLDKKGIFADAVGRDLGRSVIIAGTNGKGTVGASLEALCLAANERVGFFSSPHLLSITERIRVNGQPVSTELFLRAYEAIAEAGNQFQLSYFEMLVLMALWIFTSGEGGAPVDRILWEVGLGGTWDPTNAVPHGLCIITQLGLDHQDRLGSTLAEIAQNKLGVLPK